MVARKPGVADLIDNLRGDQEILLKRWPTTLLRSAPYAHLSGAKEFLAMSTSTPADHFHLFTSESVSEGHLDKLADRILDAFLERDPHARVVCKQNQAHPLFVVQHMS